MFSEDFASNHDRSDIENIFSKDFNKFTISDEDYDKMKVFFENAQDIQFKINVNTADF